MLGHSLCPLGYLFSTFSTEACVGSYPITQKEGFEWKEYCVVSKIFLFQVQTIFFFFIQSVFIHIINWQRQPSQVIAKSLNEFEEERSNKNGSHGCTSVLHDISFPLLQLLLGSAPVVTHSLSLAGKPSHLHFSPMSSNSLCFFFLKPFSLSISVLKLSIQVLLFCFGCMCW